MSSGQPTTTSSPATSSRTTSTTAASRCRRTTWAAIRRPASSCPSFGGVYDNTVRNNISTGNGGAGVGMFAPFPGAASYNNVVEGNAISGNGEAGVSLHGHAPGAYIGGNKILNNIIGPNNLAGDRDVSPKADLQVDRHPGLVGGHADHRHHLRQHALRQLVRHLAGARGERPRRGRPGIPSGRPPPGSATRRPATSYGAQRAGPASREVSARSLALSPNSLGHAVEDVAPC